VTESYTHPIGLHQIATAAGRSAEELRADPALVLHGAIPRPLAALLADHEDKAVAVGEPEVEVTDAYVADQSTLDDLIRAGWQHLHARPGTDHHRDVGPVLAALLIGLRREGITDR
jgi:hypothetical protein